MVPSEFLGFFAAAGTAAGALIGLLFVAVTLRPESVLGDKADPAARAVAGSAFTALVASFAVALRRAWSLLQGRHTIAEQASRPA